MITECLRLSGKRENVYSHCIIFFNPKQLHNKTWIKRLIKFGATVCQLLRT
jgi:hypothetical protein